MENKVNKALIVLDDTKMSRSVISSYQNLLKKPESVVLLYVQRLEGRSLLIDMLGNAEMSTLKDAMKEGEHKSRLDERAERVLDHYRRVIEDDAGTNIKCLIRAGHPAEEILKVADEEGVGLMILGDDQKKGVNRLIAGSSVREVREKAKVPVLVAKRVNICEEPYTWRDAFAAISVTTILMAVLYFLGIFLQGSHLQH